MTIFQIFITIEHGLFLLQVFIFILYIYIVYIYIVYIINARLPGRACINVERYRVF